MAILGWVLLLSGSAFCLIGAVGLLRLPEFFSRVHASSIIDSLGAILMLSGLITQAQELSTIIKLLLILFFLMLTGPTAVHALARTAILAEKQAATDLDQKS